MAGEMHDRATFARRDGTSSQHGIDNQYQVAAVMLARALARDPQARVGAEHAHAGVFDDVSVRVRPAPGRPPVLLLLQLKHKHNDNKGRKGPLVNAQSMRSESGPFSALKYYRSYNRDVDAHQLGAEPRSTFYVLFTNAGLPEDQLKVAPVGAGAVPAALPRSVARMLNTGYSVSGQPHVLAPHFLADETRSHEFLPRFLWLGWQASDVELVELLAQELIQHMRRVPSDAHERARALIRAVEEWYAASGEVGYLTAQWEPWRRLVLEADTPLLQQLRFHENEIKRLTDAVADVPMGGVLLLASDTADEEVRGAKMAQVAARRPLLVARPAAGAEAALRMWENGWCRELALLLPTTAMAASEVQKLGERLLNALGAWTYPARPDGAKGRALVLLAPPVTPGRPEPALASWLRERLSPKGLWKEAEDTVAFRLLAPDARAAVLGHPALFQGRACALRDLRQEHVLDVVLRGDTFARLLRSEKAMHLGQPFQTHAEDEPYVARRLQKHVAVRAEALRAQGLRDVFVVKDTTRETLQELAPAGERVQLLDRHAPDTRFVACRKMSWPKFREFSEQHPGRRCHFLKMDGGTLTWRQSLGEDGGVSGENPLLGFLDAESEELENNTAFVKNCASCTPFEEQLATSGVRTVLVCGEPGAGKSETLRRVASSLCERRPEDWVVRLSLVDHEDELAEAGAAAAAAESLLLRAAGVAAPAAKHADSDADASDTLAAALLRDRLWQTGGLRVLVDGCDEISSDYTEFVFEILKVLQASCVTSLWITSRNMMEDRLEAELHVRAFWLKPLTVADQEEFWVKFWTGPLRSTLSRESLESKANSLLKQIGGRSRNQMRLNIPMHTSIMAKIYGRAFLSDKFEIDSLHRDNFIVYDKFIQMKYEIYCEQKAPVIGKSNVIQRIRDVMHGHFMENHKLCALLETGVFDCLQPRVKQDISKITNQFIINIQNGKEKTGIIVGIFCGKPRFINRTFAEYFAAQWIADNHMKYPEILERLLEKQFKFLKCFTDQILSKHNELHQAIINEDVDNLKQILSKGGMNPDAVDGGGRTALVLALEKNSEEGYEMSKHLLSSKENFTRLGAKELNSAAKAGAWNNVRLLISKGVTLPQSVADNEHVQNVLEKAFFQKLISEEDMNMKLLDVNWNIFSNARSILHLAVQSGQRHSAGALLQMGANIKTKDCQLNTPLHYAVSHGDVVMIDSLLSMGAYSSRNIKGETPLYLACSLGNAVIVRMLIDKGAARNAPSKTGSTLLHAAVDFPDVMKILLEQEFTVDAKDSSGYTALHDATRRRSLRVISLLVQRGANVNCSNFQSDTPLLTAVNNDCLSSATILLKAGANVSDVTSSGDTPLHIAVRKNNIPMVSLLLEYGADENFKNIKGDSPTGLPFSSEVAIQNFLKIANKKTLCNPKTVRFFINSVPVHENGMHDKKGYWEEEEEVSTACSTQTSVLQRNRESQKSSSNVPTASPAAKAFLVAISQRKTQAIKNILATSSKDASLWTAVNSAGDTALHLAVRGPAKGPWSLVVDNAPKTALEARNAAGDAPIHLTARGSSVEKTQSLFSAGADRCAVNGDGDTLLHIACRYNVYAQVRFMAERVSCRPAEMHVPNKEGNTPLHVALVLSENKAERELENPPSVAGAQLLILYDTQDLKWHWEGEDLSESGKRPSKQPSNRAQIVKKLLEFTPAEVLRTSNAQGDTPLHVAARGRERRNGAHVARSGWSADVLRMLLTKEGAPSVDVPNKQGDTPLHLACRNPGNAAAITALLESDGADSAVNAVNARGDTALHDALEQHASDDVVFALLGRGADVGRANSRGETPETIACRLGRTLIRAAGPSPAWGIMMHARQSGGWHFLALPPDVPNVELLRLAKGCRNISL